MGALTQAFGAKEIGMGREKQYLKTVLVLKALLTKGSVKMGLLHIKMEVCTKGNTKLDLDMEEVM